MCQPIKLKIFHNIFKIIIIRIKGMWGACTPLNGCITYQLKEEKVTKSNKTLEETHKKG